MLLTIITPWTVGSAIVGGIFLIAFFFTFIHEKEEKKQKKEIKKEEKEEEKFLKVFTERGV